MLALLLAIGTQLAGAGLLEEADERRLACLQRRVADGIPSAQSCGSLSQKQRVVVRELSEAFCANPSAVCASLFRLREEVPSRLGDLVNSRCEPPSLDNQVVDFESSRQTALVGLPGATESARLADSIRRGWGCDDGTGIRLSRGGGAPQMTESFTCRTSQMPFTCTDTPKVVTRTAPGNPARSRTGTWSDAFAVSQFLLRGGALRPGPDGQCVLTVRRALGVDAPEFSENEPLSAVTARAAGAARAHLESEATEFREERSGVFNATARLFDHDSAHFRHAARAILTPDRVRRLNALYESSMRAVESYLTSVGAPPEALRRIRTTKLLDYSAFTRSPPTARDEALMQEVEQSCGKDRSTAMGEDNAENSSKSTLHLHGTTGSHVILCPASILEMDLSDPKSQALTLMHEFGHTLDTCSMGSTQSAVAGPLDTASCRAPGGAEATPAERRELAPFAGKVLALGECLHAHSEMETARPAQASACAECRADIPACRARDRQLHFRCVVSPPPGPQARPAAAAEKARELADFLKSVNPRYNDCALRQYATGGALAQCDFPGPASDLTFARFAQPCMNAQQKGRLKELLAALKASVPGDGPEEEGGPQKEQSGEVFSDYLAAESLPFLLEDPSQGGPVSALDRETRQADVLTGILPECGGMSREIDPSDEHSHSFYRMATVGRVESVRRLMGCAPAAAPGSQSGQPDNPRFPSARCRLAP